MAEYKKGVQAKEYLRRRGVYEKGEPGFGNWLKRKARKQITQREIEWAKEGKSINKILLNGKGLRLDYQIDEKGNITVLRTYSTKHFHTGLEYNPTGRYATISYTYDRIHSVYNDQGKLIKEKAEGNTEVFNPPGRWRGSRLERESLGILGAGILGAILFFSNNITGNVISNVGKSDSNIIGALFLIFGIVGALIAKRR